MVRFFWSADEIHSWNNYFRPAVIILKRRAGELGESSQSGKVLGVKKKDRKKKEIGNDVVSLG